jgi:hypothetical protein
MGSILTVEEMRGGLGWALYSQWKQHSSRTIISVSGLFGSLLRFSVYYHLALQEKMEIMEQQEVELW